MVANGYVAVSNTQLIDACKKKIRTHIAREESFTDKHLQPCI